MNEKQFNIIVGLKQFANVNKKTIEACRSVILSGSSCNAADHYHQLPINTCWKYVKRIRDIFDSAQSINKASKETGK